MIALVKCKYTWYHWLHGNLPFFYYHNNSIQEVNDISIGLLNNRKFSIKNILTFQLLAHDNFHQNGAETLYIKTYIYNIDIESSNLKFYIEP